MIFVSHRLDEVLDLADRVVVLRDGRLVADTPVADLDHDELVRLIVGAALEQAAPRETGATGRARAAASAACAAAPSATSTSTCAPARWSACPASSAPGASTSPPLLFGALPRTGGEVAVGGGALAAGRSRAPRSAAGVAYVPADRHADGAVMTMRVRENLTLPDLRRLRRRGGRLDARGRAARGRRLARARRAAAGRPRAAARALQRRQPAEGRAGEVAAQRARACCCSTSRPRASTSAPRPPSTTLVHDAAGAGRGRPDGVVGHRRAGLGLRSRRSSCATARVPRRSAAPELTEERLVDRTALATSPPPTEIPCHD